MRTQQRGRSQNEALADILANDRELLNRLGNVAGEAPTVGHRSNDELVDALASDHRAAELMLTLSLNEAAAQVGIPVTSLVHRIGARQVSALLVERHGYRIPHWQLTPSRHLLPGLECIVRSLPARLPIESLDSFLRIPNEDCDDASPLDYVLAGGDPRVVAELVSELGTF